MFWFKFNTWGDCLGCKSFLQANQFILISVNFCYQILLSLVKCLVMHLRSLDRVYMGDVDLIHCKNGLWCVLCKEFYLS